ncbi:MAG: aldo/keto reductase [Pseudomonadota bacterium]
MERVKLLGGGELSRIAYGMWRLGDDPNTSPAHVQAKIEACLAQGVTTMDQADIYGGYAAEEILGNALRAAPALKDRIEIVTKCGIVAPAGRYASARVKHYDTTRTHIEASVDHSLRLMGIDAVDVLLIHRPDPLMDHRETGAALDSVVASGKVKAVGVSNFRPHDWMLLQSAMETPLVTNQIEVSLVAHRGLTNGDIAFLQERNIPPMAWSPLGGGSLFSHAGKELRIALREVGERWNVDESAVAVGWLLHHPARIIPVMGTNDPARIERIGNAARIKMDRETWFDLYTHALGREVP